MSLQTNIQTLLTAQGTSFKQLSAKVGDPTVLATVDKTSLVGAINEIAAKTPDAPPQASDTVAGVVELATLAEVATGTDTSRAVTPAGVKSAIDALIAGAPGALDTLKEISDQLASDENAVSALTATVAGKQPLDADLTAIAALPSAADTIPYATGAQSWALTALTAAARSFLAAADAAAQRTSLSVYSEAEIGDVNHDFAADWAAAIA